MVESKRWLCPLDRRSGQHGEETAPSTQMLRYLRRIDDVTTGRLLWGFLTDGARWRLYYQGARSVSEQFFEVDLPAIPNLPGHNEGLFALTEVERRHTLKVFALVFRRKAFLPGAADARTFHQRAIAEGRFYEERVAASLSDLVFGQVFPELARAIAAAEPATPLPEVREGRSAPALPASLHPFMPKIATCCPSATSSWAVSRPSATGSWRTPRSALGKNTFLFLEIVERLQPPFRRHTLEEPCRRLVRRDAGGREKSRRRPIFAHEGGPARRICWR